MAQAYQTPQGTLIVPGAYPNIEVEASASGLPVSGVMVLMGESDAGPAYSQETALSQNWFSPTQDGDVRAKYGTGRLVDAFVAAVTPSADVKLVGAPTRIYLVKTNVSDKASKVILNLAGGTYHTLADRNYGENGNLYSFTIAQKTPEIIPTTGLFTLLVPNNATDITFRANGGTAVSTQLTALDTPDTIQAQLDALSGIACTGGVNRAILTVAGTLALAATGNSVAITRSIAWAVNPVVGDTLYIPSGSVIQGATNKNRGSYVVTSVTNTVVVATKLLDDSGGAGALTAPESVAATAAVAVTDVEAYSPLTVTLETALPIDGAGKNLEVNELTSSTGRFTDLCYSLNTTKVTWISKSTTPKLLTSASEYSVTLNVARSLDNVVEAITAGGQIAMSIGYKGTTATLTVTATGLSTTVTGGAGSNLNLTFSKYPTISDLCTFINAQPGYTCSVTTTLLGQKAPTMLDEVSALGICSDFGNKTGRLKVDAVTFFTNVQTLSSALQLGTTTATNIPAVSGLPAVVSATTYLSGGTKGGTTEAGIEAAITALEKLRVNFVVPLMSRDASADIADGETDSSSTYTIANINALVRTHVINMSTMRRKRHRQAFLSLLDSFTNDQNAANQLAHGRVSLSFLDFIRPSVGQGIVQYQPWMSAVIAAGMQAAGFYKGIVHRTPNQNGVVMRDGSYDPSDLADVERALLAGLLPIKTDDSDNFVWASDQTTYTKDANFYWNSVQAVYVGDQIALKLSRDLEDALVGESQADITAAQALNVLKSIMGECLRLKLTAPSDDAPGGYKNARVEIKGTAAIVNVESKLAGLIYFVPINLKISQVSSSASG